ncbi:hypothetical protein [Melaminivora sp.]|uniref:hypothetical protein n=1 Tax=Melaminivora sp. TaxID=1933032 RepID=UPI0028A5E6FC|nr:hypothetical protein [Melaminivora sp.]
MTDIVEPIPIPPGPPVPNSADDEISFDLQYEAFLAWQKDVLQPGANVLAAATQQNAAATHELVQAAAQTLADTQQVKTQALAQTKAIADQAVADTNAIKNAAAQSASQAADSAAAAQAVANFVGPWSELSGAVAKGSTTYHAGRFWVSLQAIPSASAAEPGVSPAWAKTGGGIDSLAYDSRAQFRGRAGASGDLVLVDGLGLFAWETGSDEPDDDESCFAAAAGRWLLAAAHPDLLAAWSLPDDEIRESAFSRAAAGQLLRATASCALSSVAATAQARFPAFLPGALPGQAVLATPLAALDARLAVTARVSAADTVTVTLSNPSAAAASTIAAQWQITVFKES